MYGGTGRDIVFLGWGDDVGNIDDVLNTNNGLNDFTDTNPSWEDFVYGGAGIDVMIGNTGGDHDPPMCEEGHFNSAFAGHIAARSVESLRLHRGRAVHLDDVDREARP